MSMQRGYGLTEALSIDDGTICCQRSQDTVLPDRYDAHKVFLEVFEDTRDLLLVRIVPVPAATAELCRLFFCWTGSCCYLGFVLVR